MIRRTRGAGSQPRSLLAVVSETTALPPAGAAADEATRGGDVSVEVARVVDVRRAVRDLDVELLCPLRVRLHERRCLEAAHLRPERVEQAEHKDVSDHDDLKRARQRAVDRRLVAA
ncbi:MAG: hypothetical protein V4463_04165, partial [Pseudomonadota bacterium]